MYLFAIKEFLRYNILLGSGIGSLKPRWAKDFDATEMLYGNRELVNILDGNTYSIYLRFLCLNGIIGIGLLLLIIFSLSYIAFKNFNLRNKLSNDQKALLFFSTSFYFSCLFIGLFDEVVFFNIIRYINLFFMLSISLLLRLDKSLKDNNYSYNSFRRL